MTSPVTRLKPSSWMRTGPRTSATTMRWSAVSISTISTSGSFAELLLPGEREDEAERARVHERAELELSHRVQQVRDGDLYDHLAHVGRPPRIEGPDAGHRLTSLQYLESSYHGHPCPPRPAAPARS